MSQNQDHFLDSNTLIALVLLVLSWFLWDSYMKSKYPESFRKKIITKEEDNKTKNSIPKGLKNKTLSKAILNQDIKTHAEQEFWFEGKELDILFSSKGFGIKKVRIKNYYNRDGKVVEFDSQKQALFSSYFKEGVPVPFNIEGLEKDKNKISAFFSSSELDIKKEVTIDEPRFLLEVQTVITLKTEENISDWKLYFSHPFPQNKNQGFLSFLSIYGMDSLKGFIFYKGKEKERFYEIKKCKAEETTCHNYPQSKIIALGGKYFGKAFINQAELLPSVQLKGNQKEVQAEIRYQFLHNKKQELKYQVFLGPKSLESLESSGGNLRLWLDFGFFSWLARPLLMTLTFFYGVFQNWGLAIIFLTLIIRLLLLPINIKSYKSMKTMQKIQPEIKEIRETYKEEPKKMNEEVMALMKKNKANPLGGCLPMFLQLPVFFALYRVLGESIELYQSPFFLWIQDLSLKDPYYIFPILGGLVLFVQQLITPMNLPKEQARLMKIIPLVFSVFMLNLPSGLTIYIFVSGLFGLAQQSFFTKTKSF